MSQLYNTSPKERYIFNFINSYKNKIYQYSFHTDVTIKYFIEFITYEFATYLEPNNTIEIIEIDKNIQPINIDNLPKINYSETSILSEIFNNKWDKILFYIRLKPYNNIS
jgi:hypothetical protein